MNAASRKYSQPTLWDMSNATSSQGLGDGLKLFDSQDGRPAAEYGQDPAHVNHSAQRANGKARKTKDTSGQSGLISSRSVSQKSCLESKSHLSKSLETTSPHEKTCKGCLTSKTLSEFSANKDGKCRNYCRECSNTKRSEKRKNEYLEMRTTKRGHVLVAAAKYRAGKMGIPFDLCEKDIQSRIEAGRCELTGMEFDLLAPKAWNTPSLDQIKPGAGYTRDNVRVILYAMNVMSHTWGPNKVAEIAMALMEKRKERSNDLSDRIGMQLQKTLPTGSLEYELTWIRRVTPSGRVYWQHRASGHRTSGSDCTGWPTPQTVDGAKTGMGLNRGNGKIRARNTPQSLTALAGWPTPAANEFEPTDIQRMLERREALKSTGVNGNGFGMTLSMLTGWVSPSCRDWKDTGTNPDGSLRVRLDQLPRQAQLAGWSTPRAQDNDQGNHDAIAKAGSSWLGQNRGATVSTQAQLTTGVTSTSSPAEMEKRGVLNPEFVAWLMGYSQDWLKCAPSTAKGKKKCTSAAV